MGFEEAGTQTRKEFSNIIFSKRMKTSDLHLLFKDKTIVDLTHIGG